MKTKAAARNVTDTNTARFVSIFRIYPPSKVVITSASDHEMLKNPICFESEAPSWPVESHPIIGGQKSASTRPDKTITIKMSSIGLIGRLPLRNILVQIKSTARVSAINAELNCRTRLGQNLSMWFAMVRHETMYVIVPNPKHSPRSLSEPPNKVTTNGRARVKIPP